MKLRLTDEARADLSSIRAYTAREFGAQQATRYMMRLRGGFKTLRQHPEIGYRIDHLKPDHRCFQIGYHRIFYTMKDDIIVVVAVLHDSQLPKRHWAQRDTK